jgi:hypothetical protein
MENQNSFNENNSLVASPHLADASEGTGRDEETLFDYLCRTGKAAFREIPLFVGWKRPKRPKPTFTWPRVPSLF